MSPKCDEKNLGSVQEVCIELHRKIDRFISHGKINTEIQIIL